MSTDDTTQGAAQAQDSGVRLAAGDAELTVHPDNGCRIGSLRVGGVELLRQGAKYGCFPMVPWCGRIEHGRFRNGAELHRMPVNSPPHAIHGTGRDVRWKTARADAASAAFTYDLADPAAPWPYPGTVTQLVELADDGGSLTLTMGVEALSDSFPAQAGWHPWFVRHLGVAPGDEAAGGSSAGVRLDFAAAWQEERGDDHLPTGRRIDPSPSALLRSGNGSPTPGLWDDCFGMPQGVDVTVTWPGRLELKITSRAEWVVVYDEQEAAVCVEPQSGPPNGLNTLPRLVTPIDPLEISTTWSWRSLG
ncbi:aldose epimerase family protein [Streptomyces pinistramenti]|uniref:aldose epimerase family protein n=1 Tax=Streptomyces pinistramenti TaxID=2884812 RepID=UPI001D06BAA7|nr:aldose 1-epimerase [Streptomyces pinistramenti]MCB5908584.1 aldose 1-epimerase [Streptomyces pinistramenti]